MNENRKIVGGIPLLPLLGCHGFDQSRPQLGDVPLHNPFACGAIAHCQSSRGDNLSLWLSCSYLSYNGKACR